MMIFDNASVRIGSSPRPTSMRTLRSFGATMRRHTVIQLLRADAPVAAELIAIVFDGVALQRGDRDHHYLVGALVLERLEIGGERLLISRVEQVRVIDDPTGERGEGGLGSAGENPAIAPGRYTILPMRHCIRPFHPSLVAVQLHPRALRTSLPALWSFLPPR